LEDPKNKLKEKVLFLFDVLKRYDHYIGTTNFKVGLLLSFLATVIILLSTRIMSLETSHISSTIVYIFALLFYGGTIISSLLAVNSLLTVVFPNTKNDIDSSSLIFYGDVSNTANGASGYFKKVKEATTEDLINDLATQTYIVAGIVDEKFKVLKKTVRIVRFAVIPFFLLSLLFLTFL